MKIKIYYQGILAEKTGITSESLTGKVSSSEFYDTIVKKHPALQDLYFVTAVNGVISHGDKEIKEGDCVTLIPPAPGG